MFIVAFLSHNVNYVNFNIANALNLFMRTFAACSCPQKSVHYLYRSRVIECAQFECYYMADILLFGTCQKAKSFIYPRPEAFSYARQF